MKTILIIEDNSEIRENTTEILELGGYNVITAVDGRDGIAVALELHPDVILCDIMMPHVDGYDVLKNLQQNVSTAEIPFIYVTASAEKSEEKRALEMGARGYVRKPFDVRDLMDAIEKILSK